MLQVVYAHSPSAALHDLFPALQPWQGGAHVPRGYWRGPSGREHAQAATRWLLAQLGLPRSADGALAGTVTEDVFAQWGLSGMLKACYGGSPLRALADVFPAVPPWQLGVELPHGYWRGTTGRAHAQAATRWLVAHLGLTEVAQLATLTGQHFIQAGLNGMLQAAYASSPTAALRDIDPELQPWQLGVPVGYWQGEQGREHARAATRWLLTRLGLEAAEPQEVLATVREADFRRYGLRGMIKAVYGDRVRAALRAVLDVREA